MRRTANLLGFVAVVAIFAFVLYAQYVEHYQPCPLCLLQRAFLLLLGLAFLAAVVFPGGRWAARFWALVLFVFAILGATVALRQVWLQYFAPPQVASCGANLDWMLRHLPFTETLELVFRGTGDCAVINWTLWGLSMPVWSFLCFVFLGAWGVWANLRGARR
jgi:disulfide bond formation protein DsbB